MTSCAYNYLYVQYKTRLITECTVHCPMAYDCFLTMGNWLCLVLQWLHLIFLGQICDVLSLGEMPLVTLKAGCEQRLNHWCAEDKDKKEQNIKGERDCKGTLERQLALFSDTFNQTALVLSQEKNKRGMGRRPEWPITKQDLVIQRDSNRVPQHCYESRERPENDTMNTP